MILFSGLCGLFPSTVGAALGHLELTRWAPVALLQWWLELRGSARAGPADLALNWRGGQSAHTLSLSHAPRRFFNFLENGENRRFSFFFWEKGLKLSPRIYEEERRRKSKKKVGKRNLCREPESDSEKATKKSRLAAFLENEAEIGFVGKITLFRFKNLQKPISASFTEKAA